MAPSSMKTWCVSSAPQNLMSFSGSGMGAGYGHWSNAPLQGALQPGNIVYAPTPDVYYADVNPDYKGKFDPDKKCPACGCEEVDVKFMRNLKFKLDFIPYGISTKPSSASDVSETRDDKSYMLRTCRRCGCDWHEIPLYLVPKIMEKKMTGGHDESKQT